MQTSLLPRPSARLPLPVVVCVPYWESGNQTTCRHKHPNMQTLKGWSGLGTRLQFSSLDVVHCYSLIPMTLCVLPGNEVSGWYTYFSVLGGEWGSLECLLQYNHHWNWKRTSIFTPVCEQSAHSWLGTSLFTKLVFYTRNKLYGFGQITF